MRKASARQGDKQMKKNTMKMACNAAMHHNLGHKPTTSVSGKPKGKLGLVLGLVIGVLVFGVTVAFALAK